MSQLRAAKVCLMRMGSRHVRHSRHGVLELHPFRDSHHAWIMCRCGHATKVSGLALAQAAGR